MDLYARAERRCARRLHAYLTTPPRTVERYRRAVLLAEATRLMRRLDQRIGGMPIGPA